MERLRDEITQNEPFLKKITRQVYDSAEVVGVKPFKSGMLNFNIELIVKNPDVALNLRIFCGQDAEIRAKRENTAYMIISENTDIPIPKVLVVDYSKSLIDSVFSLQTRVAGENLDDVCSGLASSRQEQVADQIGRVLGQLNHLTATNFGDLSTEEKPASEETWYEHMVLFVTRNLSRSLAAKHIDNHLYDRVLNHFDRWGWIVPKEVSPSLVHRDVHLGNIKVQQDALGNFNLSGILDFEHAFAGHSEYELAMLYLEVFNRYPIMKNPLLQGYSETNTLSDGFDLRVNKVYKLAKMTEFLDFCAQYHLPQEESDRHIRDIEGVID